MLKSDKSGRHAAPSDLFDVFDVSRRTMLRVALAPTGNAAGATWGAGLTLLHFSSFGGTGGI